MVRNHVEEKREAVMMAINYRKLNDNTTFDDYYITNKTVPFNIIQRASWFLKMDCKKRILADKIR